MVPPFRPHSYDTDSGGKKLLAYVYGRCKFLILTPYVGMNFSPWDELFPKG
jgi:hypothetical protein